MTAPRSEGRSGPATPDHWVWHDGEVDPGGAVVFDLDGVLANADHRQHLLTPEPGQRKSWKRFFEQAGDDALIEEVARLTLLIDSSLQRVLLTARPTTIKGITVAWLDRFHLAWDLLVMRPAGEYAPSPVAKKAAVDELRAHGFELLLAFDDDRRNVDMFHAAGIPCIYIHSGYYEA